MRAGRCSSSGLQRTELTRSENCGRWQL